MPRDDERGLAAALRRWWRPLLGELLGTALLVLLGVASLLPLPAPPPLVQPALAFACVVAGNVQALGAVSGAHMNPAVSLAAVLAGELAALPALGYAAAQLLGAVLGFGALVALVPAATFADGAAGCTLPAPGVGPAAACAVEAVLTGTLALVACGVWAAPGPDHAAPVKLGLAVGGLVLAGGALSGASLNPARSLAPALLLGAWQHHWVYWVGPLGGAALATLLHRWVLLAPAARPRRPRPGTPAAAAAAACRDQLPLHDKPDH